MDTPLDQDPLRLARDVRPQGFGSAAADRIREPVVEPAWPGLRVIAAFGAGEAVILDDGELVEGHDDIVEHFVRQLTATVDAVIVDGYLTKQVVDEDSVIYTGTDELPSTGKLIAQSMMGSRRNRAEEAAEEKQRAVEARTFEEDDLVNLVIVDLLWLDGEWLLDVPLLERKRLLEAIVPGDDLVRAGMYVRPPIATWIGSWRAQGFAGITFKDANSRYRPGQMSREWASSQLPRR